MYQDVIKDRFWHNALFHQFPTIMTYLSAFVLGKIKKNMLMLKQSEPIMSNIYIMLCFILTNRQRKIS